MSMNEYQCVVYLALLPTSIAVTGFAYISLHTTFVKSYMFSAAQIQVIIFDS